MNQYKTIEQYVLEKITPNENDRIQLQEIIVALSTLLAKELMKQKNTASIELVGSTAKDTYLKHNLDIDMFILFPPSYPKDTIAQTTLQIGRTILSNTEECYAEHPYIRGRFFSYNVEIVPCYQITDTVQKISAVDRTPFHTRYIQNHLQETQKQEVRLLKQFLKGINCYGAEAEVQGFSGYLCELLVLKFHSFHQLLSHAQHWKKPTTLSLTDHPIASFSDPLIFIDPVDPERNVAAAVSSRSYHQFITACHCYLKHPKTTFFFPKPITAWSLEKIKEMANKQSVAYIGIRFKKPQIINENLYPQLRKACKAIERASTREGFTIHDTCFHIDTKKDKVYILIKTKKEPISETYTHEGPPLSLQKHTKEFIKKWKNHPATIKAPFQQNERTYVTIRRAYQNLSDYLNNHLLTLSLGRHIDASLAQEYEILSQSDLMISDLCLFWTAYLNDKNPWERSTTPPYRNGLVP